MGQFICASLVSMCFVYFLFVINCCQYQCSQLLGTTRLRNDLICVDWRVEAYRTTVYAHSLTITTFTIYHKFAILPVSQIHSTSRTIPLDYFHGLFLFVFMLMVFLL